ncbi:hypothetical protein ABIE38_002666 [Dietzia sp. 2505]|uniref:hypothetical protein n=1 Tax=Dietzia sp. 2505 TaxID=3156457 RepID=UPI00339147DA
MRTISTCRAAVMALIAAFLVTVLPAPAVAQSWTTPGESPGTIAIGLRGAPTEPGDDPRARRYIVDHLRAGATTTRRLEVSNNTDSPQRIEVYPGPAALQGGSFLPAAPGHTSALTRWIRVDRPVLHLQPGASAEVIATISVPAEAPDAEQYGVIWASHTSAAPGGSATGPGTGSVGSAGSVGSVGSAVGSLGSAGSSGGGSGSHEVGLDKISRVGVRVYLSTGAGDAPGSGFEIADLRPAWTALGVAAVLATVSNTGQRAVDVAGTLDLTGGPGGLSSPPIAAEPVTIAPGETAEVRFPLSADLPVPAGVWNATVALASGAEKQTRAQDIAISPPDNGAASDESTSAASATVRPLGAGVALVSLLAALLLWFLVHRRRESGRA